MLQAPLVITIASPHLERQPKLIVFPIRSEAKDVGCYVLLCPIGAAHCVNCFTP